MVTNDEVLDFIAHAISQTRYDPAKAKEYYLRTRKLKGRQPGVVKTTSSRPSAKTKPLQNSKKQIKRVSVPSKAMASNAALRVGALKKKLANLQGLLSKLIQKAKNSDSGKSKDTSRSGSKAGGSTKSRSESSDLTSAEKSKKAKKARDDYEKVDKKAGDSESLKADTQAQIKKVRAQIAQIKKQLKAATGTARASSKTKKK